MKISILYGLMGGTFILLFYPLLPYVTLTQKMVLLIAGGMQVFLLIFCLFGLMAYYKDEISLNAASPSQQKRSSFWGLLQLGGVRRPVSQNLVRDLMAKGMVSWEKRDAVLSFVGEIFSIGIGLILFIGMADFLGWMDGKIEPLDMEEGFLGQSVYANFFIQQGFYYLGLLGLAMMGKKICSFLKSQWKKAQEQLEKKCGIWAATHLSVLKEESKSMDPLGVFVSHFVNHGEDMSDGKWMFEKNQKEFSEKILNLVEKTSRLADLMKGHHHMLHRWVDEQNKTRYVLECITRELHQLSKDDISHEYLNRIALACEELLKSHQGTFSNRVHQEIDRFLTKR